MDGGEEKLSSEYTDCFCKMSRKLFTGHVEVSWTDKQQFAAAGDCGALYSVKRGFFQPGGGLLTLSFAAMTSSSSRWRFYLLCSCCHITFFA